MKFSASTVLALVFSPIASATHVLINVQCTGVDFHKIPVMQDVFVGNVLESSFNKVHGDKDGDIRLSHVNFGLHQDDSSELGFYWGWNGSYGCVSCPTYDDDDFFVFDDDGAAMVTGGNKNMLSEKAQQLWEGEFASQLVASKHPEFNRVGKCKIRMEPDVETEQETIAQSPSSDIRVTIEAKCRGVDFHKIPLSQDIYVGNVLQHTFNTVHEDEHLIDVKFGLTKASTSLGSFFGWNGDYGCNDCKHDDSLHGKWEGAFTEALAKSGHPDFSKASKCSISLKAPMGDEMDEMVEESPSVKAETVHVHIVATCSGVDFEQLPISQDEFAGHALQNSFNKVHFDDDARLSDITFGRTNNNALGFYWGWNGSYGCVSCARYDDDDFFKDDVALGSGELKGKHHSDWEKEFETMLLESKHKPFARINNCKISMNVNMSEEPKESSVVEEASVALVQPSHDSNVNSAALHVFITAYCQGVDFTKLPLADDEFAGHALEDSFNSVHGSSDKRLSHVHYGKNQFASGLEFYWGWNGSYGCVSCARYDDDDFFKDDVSFVTEESNGIASSHTTEWQNEFSKILSGSGRKAFKTLGDCKIHMSADLGEKGGSTDFAGSKCGLRACAEI